ncbi:MAG TPA: hypothetical protein PKA06_15390, partial [Gemmatales bacterium]|nr:hypothetical protein [Gemmatales bacterium]
ETDRIKTSLKNVPSQFQKVAAKLNMNDSTKWLHSETIAPSRLLAENTGWKRDVVLHGRALILCETAGKTEYIQLGDILQIGETWKLLDAPMTIENIQTTSLLQVEAASPAMAAVVDGPLQKALKELAELDSKIPQTQHAGENQAMVAYHKKRAELINN